MCVCAVSVCVLLVCVYVWCVHVHDDGVCLYSWYVFAICVCVVYMMVCVVWYVCVLLVCVHVCYWHVWCVLVSVCAVGVCDV